MIVVLMRTSAINARVRVDPAFNPGVDQFLLSEPITFFNSPPILQFQQPPSGFVFPVVLLLNFSNSGVVVDSVLA